MTDRPPSKQEMPKYLPTPQQIAEQCELIQQRWSAADRRRRETMPVAEWEVPTVQDGGDR